MVKRARDLASGGIAVRVQDTVAAVRAFARESEPPVRRAVERGAPFDELPDARGPLLHERAHSRSVAQPVARAQRVGLVQLRRVVIGHRHRHAALCIFRGGLAQRVLGHYQYGTGGGQLDGGPQTGYTCPDHQKIRMH